ncbi:glycosyltransferase family 4 protein [Legionella jamestowniensis]|uniref:Glycosyl transferase, group 1 n=1 Tax=Legionella jamestowniensis TaxID=455 RepID=A0A0W0UGY6_9GAMM|nr:glycosyltransferase family 4 protein [Legionella jamestowniensis]KTD06809.1 glycosyl transferase, group 1 [Legionella jamestowniensis]SFL82920.1 Glycosyltransferase involved in cell wall bisynthesis [Legionella jamestowniensis DSM 19215]
MGEKIKLARIARVSTIPLFVLTQLRTQLEAIGSTGADVTIITSPDELLNTIDIKPCKFKPIRITREISLFSDFISLIKLIRIFRSQKFDIVHSNTPKAGLLCAIAAKISSVPIRLHTFTGQTWVTMSGFKKLIVKTCDKLIGMLNTHCYADSPSQCSFLIQNKVINSRKISVLGIGSLAGVNIARFNPNNYTEADRKQIRNSVKVNQNDLVLLFVGRITKDKGIFELIKAFGEIIKNRNEISLLVIGPFEQDIEQEIRALALQCAGDKIIFPGFCSEPENFIAIADILCLPSYREGFGTVVIEAAAMGVPTVGTNIYGLTDAIVDGETGLLVEPRNVEQLTAALEKLVSDDKLRKKMGQNAQKRAVNEFDSNKFGTLVVDEYEKLLNNAHPQRVKNSQ